MHLSEGLRRFTGAFPELTRVQRPKLQLSSEVIDVLHDAKRDTMILMSLAGVNDRIDPKVTPIFTLMFEQEFATRNPMADEWPTQIRESFEQRQKLIAEKTRISIDEMRLLRPVAADAVNLYVNSNGNIEYTNPKIADIRRRSHALSKRYIRKSSTSFLKTVKNQLGEKHPKAADVLARTIAAGLIIASVAKYRSLPDQNTQTIQVPTTSALTPSTDKSYDSTPISNIVLKEQNWGRYWRVRKGDTISGIAQQIYPDFNDNQPYYTDLLRFANQQDKKRNALIFPGQVLFVPNPNTPALGFIAGENALLPGRKIDGKDWPIEIRKIDLTNGILEVFFYNGTSKIKLEVGHMFGAGDRIFSIAAIINDGIAPVRVVLQILP